MPRTSGFVFVELYTHDIQTYISFFQNVAGFKLVRDEGGFAELRSDTAVILLNADKDQDLPERHPFKGRLLGPGKGVGVEIGIVKADLPVAREAALKVKGWSVTEIRRQEWGLSDFRVVTPDGYYLRFTDPSVE